MEQPTIPTTTSLALTPDPSTMLVTVSDQQVHRNNVTAWAKIMYESGNFPLKNMQAAAVKIQAGYELGFGVVASLRNIHVFDGNISVAAIGMAMKINQSPNYDYEIVESTDDACVIKFFGISKRTKQWRELGVESFTKADVATAKLSGKDNHAKYPKAMKFARAMSAGCRKYCAEVFNGAVYSPEEAAEFAGTTVEMDAEGNVISTSDNGNGSANGNGNGNGKTNGAGRINNITPIDDARSNKAGAAKTGPDRKELFAQIRGLFGITKTTLTGPELESILADMSIVLGTTLRSIPDITDAAAQAYLNRKKMQRAAEARAAEAAKTTTPAATTPTVPAPATTPDDAPSKMSQQVNAKLFVLLNAIGIPQKDKPARLAFANFYKVDVASFTELDDARAQILIDAAEKLQRTGDYSATMPWTWARAVEEAANAAADEYVATEASDTDYCPMCGARADEDHAPECDA